MRVGTNLELLPLALVSGVLALTSVACLDGQCNDEIAGCDTALAQRCHPEEAKAQACLTNADGCLVWTDTAICGPHDKCTADDGAPMCECDHGCEPQTSQCMGAVVQVCDLDEYGCLFWKNNTDCSLGGSTCAQSGDQASCGGCVDTCQAFGQSRCDGAVVQTCTNSGDGCLIWQDRSDCGATGQSCDDSGASAVCTGACTNLCDFAGQGRCDGTRVEVCTTDAAGCLRWETGADCGLTGQRCEVDGSSAACVTDVCSDTCAPENDSHCNGSAIESCTRGNDGCLHWTAGIDCEGTGQSCEDSSGSAICVGSCSDGCSPASSTRCQGDVIQTCTLGGGGCLAWLQTANCASSGATCVDGGGGASCQPAGGEIAVCGLCTQDDQCAGHTGALGGTYCQPLSEQAQYWYCLQDCTNDADLCQPGETCDGNGNCIPPNGCGVTVCTSYNPTGACPPGLQCVGGECRDPSACSSSNTTGSCPAGLTCVGGVCEQSGVSDMPVGGPCAGDEHCTGSGAVCYPEVIDSEDTGFLDGYCMVFDCTAATCPAGSTCVSLGESSICMDDCAYNSDCRDGLLCYSVSSGGVCWRGCTDSSCPEGFACMDDICQRIECTTGTDCDQGENCVGGRCVLDVANGPGQNPQGLDAALAACSLPPLECSDGRAACGELIRFDPTYGRGYADYPENGETADNQYRSWLRRDNVMMIKYATAYVDCLAANWAGHHEPLGLIDMSEQTGDIPGTSDKYCVDDTYRYNECDTQADCAAGQICDDSPGHPPGTHEDGHDIDVAYYQTQYSDNRARPICTHTDSNGRDAYHCTATPDNLDPWRTALFLGALFEHPALRIIGCDGQAGQILDSAIARLCEEDWIKPSACARDRLTYEVTDGGSGWYLFHHHHMHVSLGTASYPFSTLPRRDELCLVPGCGPTLIENYLNQPLNKPRAGLPQLFDLPAALLQP